MGVRPWLKPSWAARAAGDVNQQYKPAGRSCTNATVSDCSAAVSALHAVSCGFATSPGAATKNQPCSSIEAHKA